MLTVLSPAKSLDLTPQKQTKKSTVPEFLDNAEILVKKLRRISCKQLEELMGISPKLSALNRQRYANWAQPFTSENAKQAVLTFNGDVYAGLAAGTFTATDLTFAQKHLRILSGLYGVLRPLDLIQAYRLEMGTKLPTRQGNNLYDFWGEQITTALNSVLEKHRENVLVNLASNEYFKSVKPKSLTGRIVTPVFKEVKAKKTRTIALFAKKARGRMAAWIIRNRIETADQLVEFHEDGYKINAKESTENQLIFTRPQPPAK